MILMKRFLLLTLLLLMVFRANAQWVTQNFGLNNLNSVKFYGSSEVWIPGFNGVYISTNNGSSFTLNPLVASNGIQWIASSLNDVAVSSSSVAVGAGTFFLGNDELIVRTTDGGDIGILLCRTWEPSSPNTVPPIFLLPPPVT